MNMTSIRENSKIFLWVCLIGFVLSLVGVMGSSSGGGGFLGGASLTSLFSDSVNPQNFVGKVDGNKITRSEFDNEFRYQKSQPQQFTLNANDSYYIGKAWEEIIYRAITNNKLDELNLNTSNKELKTYFRNNPPQALKNFLVENNLFVADSTFDLLTYQNTLDKNIQWIPNDLKGTLNNYTTLFKTRHLPKAKLNYVYSLLSTVSDNEIKQNYMENNINYNIDILTIDYSLIENSELSNSLNNSYTISDSDIENYYEENLDEKYSNPKSIIVDYVLFKNITNDDDSLEIVLNDELKIKRQNFEQDADPELMGFDLAVADYELAIEDTIYITEDFTGNSGIPFNLGYNRNIVRFAFDQKVGDVTGVLTNQGYAYFRIIKIKNEHNTLLSEVKDEIKESLILSKKKEFILSEINTSLNDRESWNKLSEDYSFITLEINQEDKINGSFTSIGKNSKLSGCLSVMESNDISTMIESNNKLFIVNLNSKDEIQEDDFIEKSSNIREELINTKSFKHFTNWLKFMSQNVEIIDVRMKSI